MSIEIPPESPQDSPSEDPFEERLAELERRGVLVPPSGPMKPLRPIATIPGALERFLADRNE